MTKTHDQTVVYRMLEIMYQADKPLTVTDISEKMSYPEKPLYTSMNRIIRAPEIRSQMIINKKGRKTTYWMTKKNETVPDMYEHFLSSERDRKEAYAYSPGSRSRLAKAVPSKKSPKLQPKPKEVSEIHIPFDTLKDLLSKGASYKLKGEMRLKYKSIEYSVVFNDFVIERLS